MNVLLRNKSFIEESEVSLVYMSDKLLLLFW